MVRKTLSLCIVAVLLFVSCTDKSLQNEIDNIKQLDKIENKTNELVYEYLYEDFFVMKKFQDDRYMFALKNEDDSCNIYTKFDRGLLLGHYHFIKEKERGTDYFYYFDENAKTLTKVADVSGLDYSNWVQKYNRIFYGGHVEDGYKLIDISSNKSKKILKIDGYPSVKLSISQDYLLVSYNLDGRAYLKVMNLKDNVIEDVEVVNYENVEEGITSAYEDAEKVYYSLSKRNKDEKKYEYELVEYSLLDRKITNKYSLRNGLLELIVKNGVFVYEEISPERTKYTEDIYISKMTKDGIEEIDIVRYAPYGICGKYVDKDKILFVTGRGAYRYDTKRMSLEEIELNSERTLEYKKQIFIEVVNDEIVVLKYSKEGTVYEFRTFEELEAEYGK